MKITDLTVKRFAERVDGKDVPDGREVQTVTVHTDEGVTGMGYVSLRSAGVDIEVSIEGETFHGLLLWDGAPVTVVVVLAWS